MSDDFVIKVSRSLAEFNAHHPQQEMDALDKTLARLKNAPMDEIELLIEVAVSAAPNLFVVARGLRAALRDEWERAEVAELLMEGVEFP